MAVPANFDCPEKQKFQHCYKRLMSLVYKDDDTFKSDVNLILDQLNAIEYSLTIVREQDGNLILLKFHSFIPLHDERLLVKLCQVVVNWRRKQMLALTDTCIATFTDYLIKAIQRCPTWTLPDILRALSSIVYENCDRISQYHDSLVGRQGILIQLIQGGAADEDTLKESVQCLECLTVKPSSNVYLVQEHAQTCFNVFTDLLHNVATVKLDQICLCKILVSCLRGLQNLLQVTKMMPVNQLGKVLSAVRAYMFFGLYGMSPVISDSLYPTHLSQFEVPSLSKLGMPSGDGPDKQSADNSSGGSGQKKSKKKKSRKSTEKADTTADSDTKTDKAVSGVTRLPGATSFDEMLLRPTWTKMCSSESEWSDTEGGQGSRLRSNCVRVRQSSLVCLYWVVKNTDKKVIFGYWPSFIPDSQNMTHNKETQTLFSIILKDPAPKCRMGALAALSVMIDGTKPLLTAAEEVDDSKVTTFTPFSMVLGTTIKELHRCLLQAMVSENYPITLTQLIKCFGTVISNTPYHRLRPGLLSRIVKQIRHFINHRDPNIRVACLTCLGSMASIQPPLMEVCHIVQPSRPPVTTRQPITMDTESDDSKSNSASSSALNINRSKDPDSGHINSSPTVTSPGRAFRYGGERSSGEHSGEISPRKERSLSGGQTPVFTDQLLQAHARDISWVVKLCLKYILPQPSADSVFGQDEPYLEPLPVRLEALQVLTHLTKGYFPIIRNCVPMLQELVHRCYQDTDPVIKLHTAKLLDEFTQVLQQELQPTANTGVDRMDSKQVLDFWMSLLNGPIPQVLQDRSNNPVRASTCDCIANIGNTIFTSLPMDKRVMCITLVLGLTNDDDRTVRASAIRTLGVYVLYATLREDVSFIADATSAILTEMEDKSVAVRVKAAWSLANLCDALALNREEGDTDFMEEFSEIMLLNVINTATKGCQDSDKVKANGVRALGNVLRYIPARSISKAGFSTAIAAGIKALVKNVGTGAMKVRWNACYAVSNMYKNRDLPHGSSSWTADVINALCVAVKDCKNFKVRINAAVALTTPKERFQFGDSVLFCHSTNGLIDALETAEDIADFIDFRYRDSLTDQLCGAVLHLVSLIQQDDLDPLLSVLHTKGAFLQTCLDKYFSNKKDKSQIEMYLPIAHTHLEELMAGNNTEDQSGCLTILYEMCQELLSGGVAKQEKPIQEDSLPSNARLDDFLSKPLEKTAFLQTYD